MECEEYGDDGKRPLAAFHASTPSSRKRRRVWNDVAGCHLIIASLRARRERPHRAAESQDELAPPHSITSPARARMVGGTSRPSALAVLRLMAKSSFTER